MNNQAARVLIGGVIVCMLTGVPSLCQNRAQKDQEGAAQDCGALSMSAVLRWLDQGRIDKNARSEESLSNRITKCGVSFNLTDEYRTDIQKHRGSIKLLTAIENARKIIPSEVVEPPKPPTPIPPPVKEGRLSVTCRPVDCNISIDGSRIGETNSGVFDKVLPIGSVRLTAFKDDYDSNPKQLMAEIRENEVSKTEFTLAPTQAALEVAGANLFKQMIEALGGEAGLKASGFLKGTGTLDSSHGVTQTTCDITAIIRVPDIGNFSLTILGKKYEVRQTEGGLTGIKGVKGEQADALDMALRHVQDYQLSRTIGALQNTSYKMVAKDLSPAKGESVVFRARRGSDTIAISLDQDHRPFEIVLESSGLETGRRIRYLDYVQHGSAFYPNKMEVILPGERPQGTAVKFKNVEIPPSDVKESDLTGGKKKK